MVPFSFPRGPVRVGSGLLVISLFFKSSFVYNLIAATFSFLLGVYLIVDTQLILGGKHPSLNYDDSIAGR